MARKAKSKDALPEVDFSAVHNRNEARVLKELKKLYPELPEAISRQRSIKLATTAMRFNFPETKPE